MTLKGVVEGNLAVAGRFGDPASRHGGGTVLIHHAQMLKVPFMLAILQVIHLAVDDDNAFHDAQLRLIVDGDDLILDEIDLRGKSFSMVGAGRVHTPTEEMDLTLLVGSPLKLPRLEVLSEFVEGFARELVVVRVGGDVKRAPLPHGDCPGRQENARNDSQGPFARKCRSVSCHCSANVLFHVTAGRVFPFEYLAGFFRVGHLEYALGFAATGAGRAIGVTDVDVSRGEFLADLRQCAGSVGHGNQQYLSFRDRQVQLTQSAANAIRIDADQTQDAMLTRVGHGHGQYVDFGLGDASHDLGQDAGFVDQKHGELCDNFHYSPPMLHNG